MIVMMKLHALMVERVDFEIWRLGVLNAWLWACNFVCMICLQSNTSFWLKKNCCQNDSIWDESRCLEVSSGSLGLASPVVVTKK